MGCDIHVHIEIKVNGEWHHYNQPNVGRDYGLFAKMAGVRGEPEDGKILAPHRGLPHDATFSTKFDYERRTDYHSATWLFLREIGELEKWWVESGRRNRGLDINSDQIGYLFGNDFQGFLEHPEEYPPELQDARLICWFDN